MEPVTTTIVALLVTRAVSGIVSKVGEYVFPYKGSRDWKRQEHQAQLNRELQEDMERMRQKHNMELAVFNRQTSMIVAEYNAHINLKHSLIQDAIRNFPLNISPLVLLENNNIDVNYLLDGEMGIKRDRVYDRIFSNIDNTKPLSVFITPIYIDSRVGGKEIIASQVFDSVYSNVESIFVNEYSRNSKRPVIFYPTAWNKNVRGGLHASEEIYYFLKDLPTLVVEPRFDGSKLKIVFSCWGLGYSVRTHFRQEMSIDFDWNSILIPNVYERSKKAIDLYEKSGANNRYVTEQIKMCKHNVEMFEKLDLGCRIENRLQEIASKGDSDQLKELGDYSRLFYINNNDIAELSDMISATLGLTVASITDTHHLLASDIQPHLPQIYEKYFKKFVNDDLTTNIVSMYHQTYMKLFSEYPQLIPEKSLDYVIATQPLRCASMDDIVYALQNKTNSENCKDIESLFKKLKEVVKINSQEDIDFITKLYKAIKNSNMDEKYLVITDEILKKIWK